MSGEPVQRCVRCRTKVEKRWTASDGRSYCYECADLVANPHADRARPNGAAGAPDGLGGMGATVIRSPESVTELRDLGHGEPGDDLGGLQQHFASFVAAHTELSNRRAELLLELRGVEAQLAALNDRAGRVGSILDGAATTDVSG